MNDPDDQAVRLLVMQAVLGSCSRDDVVAVADQVYQWVIGTTAKPAATDRIERARKMWDAGVSGSRIAKELGITTTGFHGLAARHGFPKRRPPSPERLTALHEWAAKGRAIRAANRAAKASAS